MNEVYKFDGTNFDKIETWNKGFITTSFDWHSWLLQSDSVKNLGWVQGVYSSATFIRWRLVVIEGDIIAETTAELLAYVKEIKKLFSIDWIPVGQGVRTLEITDENGIVWEAQGRIKEMPVFKLEDYTGKYRATIFLSEALYKTKDLFIATWNEWILAGQTFPTTFPTAFNKKAVATSLVTATSIPTPLKITITVTWEVDSFIKILNTTNWEFYQTNTSCTAWDVIVIDADTRTATKNGSSIIWDKEAWSSWLSISENSELVISDTDLVWDFTVSIEWRDLLL